MIVKGERLKRAVLLALVDTELQKIMDATLYQSMSNLLYLIRVLRRVSILRNKVKPINTTLVVIRQPVESRRRQKVLDIEGLGARNLMDLPRSMWVRTSSSFLSHLPIRKSKLC